MTDETVFDDKVETETETENEDTLEVLQKRLTDKDKFIEQLKTENAEMRKTVENADNAAQELEQLKNELKELKENSEKNSGAQPRDNTNPSLTETDIEELVARTITKQEQERTAGQNILKANEEMIKIYGDREKASEAVKARAQELGLSMDEVKTIASKSPSAFARLVEVPKESNDRSFDKKTSVSPATFEGSGSSPKRGTKAWYDQLRKEQGSAKFFTPAIQQQLFKDKESGLYDS